MEANKQMKDILEYIQECYVLEEKWNKNITAEMRKANSSLYRRAVNRAIEEERKKGTDFPDTNTKSRFYTEKQMKRIVECDYAKNYFFNNMRANQAHIINYFSEMDTKRNDEHNAAFKAFLASEGQYIPEKNDEDLTDCYVTRYGKRYNDVSIKLFLFDLLIAKSLDEFFEREKIDQKRFREDMAKMMSLAKYDFDFNWKDIFQDGYSYLEFKLSHPTIYYSAEGPTL